MEAVAVPATSPTAGALSVQVPAAVDDWSVHEASVVPVGTTSLKLTLAWPSGPSLLTVNVGNHAARGRVG